MRRRWPRRSGRARTPLRSGSPAGRSSNSSRRRRGARCPSARPMPCSGSPASPAPAGPDGRWVPRPARGRWSATAQPPRTCTARRSTALAVPACGWIWAALIWSTASGCAASGVGVTLATSSAARTRCSTGFGIAVFAERARIELRATGAHARQPAVGTPDILTAQEALIARLAGDGRLQPADRRAAVHQPRHRRLPPAQSLHQARRQLAQPARPRASRTARRGTAGHATGLIPPADPCTAAAVPAWPTINTLSALGPGLSTVADARRCGANIAWMSYPKCPCVVAPCISRTIIRCRVLGHQQSMRDYL